MTSATEPELVVTGGILKSPSWLKIVADLFGRSLWLPRVQEASAWGGVMLALKALDVIPSLEDTGDLIELGGRLDPDPINISVYQDTIRKYDSLYETIYPA